MEAEVARTTIVEPGDCFYNLSRQEGFHWETLWNHSNNADLRERRKHPNVLLPGDEVFVPDLTVKEVARPTDQRHRFVHKGVQADSRSPCWTWAALGQTNVTF